MKCKQSLPQYIDDILDQEFEVGSTTRVTQATNKGAIQEYMAFGLTTLRLSELIINAHQSFFWNTILSQS